MEPKNIENLTPVEAAKQFHASAPHGATEDAEKFADEHLSENSDVVAFFEAWQTMRGFSDKLNQAQFKDDVDRIWPEDKYS